MKVLHFYKSYLPYSFGGVEQSIFYLVMSSKSFGVESTVLTLSSNKKNSYIRYKEHDIFSCYKNFQISSNDFSFNAIKMFKKLSDKADIIHYHFPYPFADLLHFITNIKKPSIVTYHSDIIRQKFLLKLYRPLMLSFLNSVDLIVTSSPNYYESSEDLQHFKSKVKIVPYGLDKNLYPSPSKSCVDYWKNKLCKKFFLFLGVLRIIKAYLIY